MAHTIFLGSTITVIDIIAKIKKQRKTRSSERTKIAYFPGFFFLLLLKI
jgi:hypothetical protein